MACKAFCNMTAAYSLASSLATHCIILYASLTWTCLLIIEEIWHFSPCCFCLAYPLTIHVFFYLAVSNSTQSSPPGSLSPFLWVWIDGFFFAPIIPCSFLLIYLALCIRYSVHIFTVCIKMVYFLVLRLRLAS